MFGEVGPEGVSCRNSYRQAPRVKREAKRRSRWTVFGSRSSSTLTSAWPKTSDGRYAWELGT